MIFLYLFIYIFLFRFLFSLLLRANLWKCKKVTSFFIQRYRRSLAPVLTVAHRKYISCKDLGPFILFIRGSWSDRAVLPVGRHIRNAMAFAIWNMSFDSFMAN